VIVLGALCFFAYHYFFDRIEPREAQGTSEVPVNEANLSVGSEIWLLKRASITTDSGITGIPPGSKVRVIRSLGDSIIIDASGSQIEVPLSSLTDSAKTASEAAESDRKSQSLAAQTPVKPKAVASTKPEDSHNEGGAATGPIERLHLYVVDSGSGGIIGDPILFVGGPSTLASSGGAAGESFSPVVRSGDYIFLEGYPATKKGVELVADARRSGVYRMEGQTIPKWTWTRGSN